MPWGIFTMNSGTVSRIHDFTLQARDLIETEISEQLEGIYGFLPDGTLKSTDAYPALAAISDARRTREMIEAYVIDESTGGVSAGESRKKLVREASFTWLNRFVAFRMMETRNLIRQTISKGLSSNAFLRWLTEPGREDEYALHEEGELPADVCGEGPRHRAYRHFILWQCGELSKEIRVLFDPDSLPSRLFPRPRAIASLIEMMNAPDLSEAWSPGNEETVGWVYQSFVSRELEAAFREVRESGKKFEASDIPSVTQLFTPRWIVRYLVENTLGQLWIDMHGDSQLSTHLQYIVPLESRDGVAMKPAKEIRLLDPACGTMHFGLVAFDIFVMIYEEELEKAGQPGWPEVPSVDRREDIPASIIANNLHGIDIDVRAVQLSALTLYLKAKSLNAKVVLKEGRLACANVHMPDDIRLKEFLDKFKSQKAIFSRILTTLRERLGNSEQLGSLLRIERDITTLVQQEQQKYDREGWQPDLFGWSEECFDRDAHKKEFWDTIEHQIRQALDWFVKLNADKGMGQTFFSRETIKGLNLLDILSQSYDVVVTNPPYISGRKMNNRLKSLIAERYPMAKGDIYASFIQRCVELAGTQGRVGMLTMHSFMFISSYESLREWLRDRVVVHTMAHCGPGLFAVGNPGTLQTAAYVLTREPEQEKRDGHKGTYFRLVKELDCEAKRNRFETALSRLRLGEESGIVYHDTQKDFDAILGSPWVYWVSGGLRAIFSANQNLRSLTEIRQGLATADNFRFLKYCWEIGYNSIGFNCSSREECETRPEKWYPYNKGGSFLRWYGNQDYCINYGQNGFEIKAWADPLYGNSGWSRIIKSTEFYFRRGVTYSYLTSATFSARISLGGFIFDVAGSSLFPENVNLFLALLNSSLARYLLKLINPTVNFQVGDLARLPVPDHSSTELEELVEKAVELAKDDSRDDETTYDFIIPPDWQTGIADVTGRRLMLDEIEHLIDEEVYSLYGLSEEDKAAIEMELSDAASGEGASDEEGATSEDEDDEAQENPAALTSEALARKWISYAVGVVMGRFRPGIDGAIGRGRFNKETAERLRSLCDADAIMVMDEGHSDDLPACVMEALVKMHGGEAAAEIVRAGTGSQGDPLPLLRVYLERSFFKMHIQQYRKRPVYWLLQSPKKKYGVWLFHERMTQDTLYRIKTEYVEHKIKLIETQARDLTSQRDALQGRERRAVEKKLAAHNEISDDIREFKRYLEYVINDRHFAPHIDDGVLITMAPLWELIPSWQSEPKKAWEALSRGDYDWAGQAMDHWPDRVREKCRTNRSFAISHRLMEGDE